MSFMTTRATLGFKIESTPYTAETLTANEYNIAAKGVSYSGEIPMFERKLARGDYSKDPSVAGKRSVKISFTVDLYVSSNLKDPPSYFGCLRACGLKQTVHGTTGVSLVTDSDYSNVPATIEVVEKDEGTAPVQVVVKARGCMGNAKLLINNVGEPISIEFEFTGVLVSITDRAHASLISPSGISTITPDAVLSAGVTMFGEAQCLNTLTIDLGNDVQLFTCPSYAEGYQGAHVVNTNPTLELDSDLELIATQGDYARLTGNETGAFLTQVGGNFSLSGPAVQLTKAYSRGDREGHVTNAKSLEFKRSSGDNELKILQGTE